MITLEIRASTFALRSVCTMDRTVGGDSMKDPRTPPGSVSGMSPVRRSTSVEWVGHLRSAAHRAVNQDQPCRGRKDREQKQDDDEPDAASESHGYSSKDREMTRSL